MLDPLRDRVQLRRLFREHFGEYTDMYGNITVEGKVSDDLNEVSAVFGLYELSPNLRYYDLGLATVDAYWFLARIRGYGFDERHAGILAEQRALLAEAHPDWQDEAVQSRLWRQTQEAFTDMGLPTSFLSYQVGLDGTHSVVFWHPRLVPADVMLQVFQLATAKSRPA